MCACKLSFLFALKSKLVNYGTHNPSIDYVLVVHSPCEIKTFRNHLLQYKYMKGKCSADIIIFASGIIYESKL